jgi:hypothetical protein
MKVIKNFNDKMNFIGYTMELIEWVLLNSNWIKSITSMV